METFNWRLQVESTAQVQFTVRKAQFGDGYVQRSNYGYNNDQRKWSAVYKGPTRADVLAVVAFLDRHAGGTSFMWRAPLDAQPTPYVCESYTLGDIGGANWTVSMEFVRA